MQWYRKERKEGKERTFWGERIIQSPNELLVLGQAEASSLELYSCLLHGGQSPGICSFSVAFPGVIY